MAAGSVQAARQVIRGSKKLCVLTGAGLSTDSGIPDYRSPGRPQVKSIQYNEFVKSDKHRQRYWGRSIAGYSMLSAATPNDGHQILARAQAEGTVDRLLTQNVDGLHQRAGSESVLELHGSIHQVVCLDCGTVSSRADLQRHLIEQNKDMLASLVTNGAAAADTSAVKGTRGTQALLGRLETQRPDGDSAAELDYTRVSYPNCVKCGGLLKPDVVFFGESLPPERSAASIKAVEQSDAMLVIGTSLTVWSAFRLVRQASQCGIDIVVVTNGPTRADNLIDPRLRFHESATESLTLLFNEL